jgi:hypothetical protein
MVRHELGQHVSDVMRIPSRAAVFTAFVSGQAAGLVMLAVAMVLATLRGRSPLNPLQVFTALIMGDGPLQKLSWSSVLPGFLAHQAGPTIVWSKVFGGVVGFSLRPFSAKRAVILGALVGALALFVDGYLLMPGIQRQLNGRNLWAQNVPLWVAWVTHLSFGVSLGFFYWRWQPRPP